jgi:hypothetical protein
MNISRYLVWWTLALFAVLGVFGCGGNEAGDGPGSGPGLDGGIDGGGDVGGLAAEELADAGLVYVDGGWFDPVCRVTDCQSHNYACGDCIDNDEDGLVDARDPDCLGPCHNSETGFNLGIPGANSAPCKQDCYFDQDTGSGNDECYWNHKCDSLEPLEPNPCNYSKPYPSDTCADWQAEQSQVCLDFCNPLTPNGCDCFGCCELGGVYRFIGSPGCNLSDLDSCSPCTKVDSCLNTCGKCELCLGKTTLPAECGTTGTDEDKRCEDGVQPCGLPGDDACAADTYCITGCCIPTGDIIIS